MKTFQKFIAAILLSSTLVVPSSMTASAISHSSSGSAYNQEFNGQWWTVAMTNCDMDYATPSVSIDDFGKGSGNIVFGAYCCTPYGLTEYYNTFSKKGSKTWNISDSGLWCVDGTNSRVTKKRTGVDVSWDIS